MNQTIFYSLDPKVGPDGDAHIRVGKLNMVDLAGSERQAKTGAAVSKNIEDVKFYISLCTEHDVSVVLF